MIMRRWPQLGCHVDFERLMKGFAVQTVPIRTEMSASAQ